MIESPKAYVAAVDHPSCHRPHGLGPGSPRVLRGRPGCPSRSWRTATTTPSRWPSSPIPSRWPSWCCSRASPPSSGRCSCCAKCSTIRTTDIAHDRRQERSQLQADLRAGAPSVSTPTSPGSKHRRSTAKELLQAFLAATRDGDLDQLIEVLAADVVFCGDGGGKVNAITQPLYGRDQVATFFRIVFEGARRLRFTFEPVIVNGGPGDRSHGTPKARSSVSSRSNSAKARSTRCESIVNPDKLRHLGPVSDALRLPDGRRRAVRRSERRDGLTGSPAQGPGSTSRSR